MKFSTTVVTLLAAAVGAFPSVVAFVSIKHQQRRRHNNNCIELNATASPRTGMAQQLLNIALKSPLWEYILVPQARASIVKTAEENGIPWVAAKEWLKNQDFYAAGKVKVDYPEYYKQSFHAYSEGNLSYDAAFEQELASRAIGARNFPEYSSKGEDVFRDAFDKALSKLGANIIIHKPQTDNEDEEEITTIVDMGCGTGTSTRRLAKQYSDATQLIGIDLSPYFIDVGRTLLQLAPDAINLDNNDSTTHDEKDDGGWITRITSDERIDLRQGDMAKTNLPSNSVSVVNLSLVLHELPLYAAKEVINEAHRILTPGGQMWISEMDFESPAYKAQRENALLFSLLRATEPYLDEYADSMKECREYISGMFDVTKITAATGRHYALLAVKGGGDDYGADNNSGGHTRKGVVEDTRFNKDGSYVIDDTHLKPWESKSDN